MRSILLAFVCCGSLATGCAAHAQFSSLPDRGEPFRTRMEAYEQYRPVTEHDTLLVTVNQYGAVQRASMFLDHVTLGSGVSVGYPEDLLPLVDPDSPTAQSARRSQSLRSISQWVFYPSLVATVAGAALMTPGVLNAIDTYGTDPTTGAVTTIHGDPTLLVGAIATFVVGIVGMSIGGVGYGSASGRERVAAFEAYPASLRSRLAICEYGDQLEDCGSLIRAAQRRSVGPTVVTPSPSLPTLPTPTGSEATTSAPSTQAEGCPAGQILREYTSGHCCWPGQTWSNVSQACAGAPRCPAGFNAQGASCVHE